MSRIKIIANCSPETTVLKCSNISKHIGKEFEVDEKWEDGAVDVILEVNSSPKTIFPSEFEWVEY